ncbi:MAG: hypothetical protein PUB22_06360 [Clostridiales bacterium]|nr:hypothetical protein [Clostridiales bacterium]
MAMKLVLPVFLYHCRAKEIYAGAKKGNGFVGIIAGAGDFMKCGVFADLWKIIVDFYVKIRYDKRVCLHEKRPCPV